MGSRQDYSDLLTYFILKQRRDVEKKEAEEAEAKKARVEEEQREKESIAKAEAEKQIEEKAELLARRRIDEMRHMNSRTLGVDGESAWNQAVWFQQVTGQHNKIPQQPSVNQMYPFHPPGIGFGMLSQQQLPLSFNQQHHQAPSLHQQMQLQSQQQYATTPMHLHPAPPISLPGINVAMHPQMNAVWQQHTHQQQPLTGVGFFGLGSSLGVPQTRTEHEHQALIQQQQVAAQQVAAQQILPVAQQQAPFGFGGLVNGMSLPQTNAAQQVALIQQQQQPAFNTSSSGVGNGSGVVQQQQSNITSLPQQQQQTLP